MPSKPPTNRMEDKHESGRSSGRGSRPALSPVVARKWNLLLVTFAVSLLVIAVVLSAGYYFVLQGSEDRTRAALSAAAADTASHSERQRIELRRKSLVVEARPHINVFGDPRMIRYGIGEKTEVMVPLRNYGKTAALDVRLHWAFGSGTGPAPADIRNVYRDSLRDTTVFPSYGEYILHLISAERLSLGDSLLFASGERSMLIYGYITFRDSVVRSDTLQYALRFFPKGRFFTSFVAPQRRRE